MSLKFGVCTEWFLVPATGHCTDQRIDVNIIEMNIELFPSFVLCFRATAVPSTSHARTPSGVGITSVAFCVKSVFGGVEWAFRGTLRPVAMKDLLPEKMQCWK
jgi:hypothetical protein